MINLIVKKMSLAIILTFSWTLMCQGQEMSIPVNVQFPLFLKILTFDRNFKARVGDEIVIGIVYQGKFKTSLNTKDEIMNAMDRYPIKKVEDISIRCVPVDIGNKPNLERIISRNDIDVLYITPLRALGVGSITSVSRAKQIMTLTGVPDYVESGLAVGIGIKGENPQIIVNLPAAKSEGANFSSQLLKLARTIE